MHFVPFLALPYPAILFSTSENEGKTCPAWTLKKHVCLSIWIWHMLSMDLAEAGLSKYLDMATIVVLLNVTAHSVVPPYYCL